MKITAIILAKDEEKKIEKTVSSLLFCDEVIVVDDESYDATVKRAEKAGAKVLLHPMNNDFASQRNWAMSMASNEWILFVDADEEVSEELKKEIISFKTTPYPLPPTTYSVAYAIPRRDFFWNTELKYGETQKARSKGVVRLMKKGGGVWMGKVHETFIAHGEVGKLDAFLNHYSHESLTSFIQEVNTYSSLRATELSAKGKKTNTLELILLPFGKFAYTYLLLGGFLDGAAGFAYSFVMSFHSFLVRAKLLTKSYV